MRSSAPSGARSCAASCTEWSLPSAAGFRESGLSATLGDMSLAAEALRPGEPENVRCIVSAAGGQELSVQVRGYLDHVIHE